MTVKPSGDELSIVTDGGRTTNVSKGSGNCFEGRQANVCFSAGAMFLHSRSRSYARQQ